MEKGKHKEEYMISILRKFKLLKSVPNLFTPLYISSFKINIKEKYVNFSIKI
jgi:hypothetical protein